MIAKSLDVVVLLKLMVLREKVSFNKIAKSLFISVSEVHAAVRRLAECGLVGLDSRRPFFQVARNFLIHGVSHVFPGKHGEVVMGMPTAYAAPVFGESFLKSTDKPPVWSDPQGGVLGFEIEPLHPNVSRAAREDAEFYGLIALVDALRIGKNRERAMADQKLTQKLEGYRDDYFQRNVHRLQGAP